MSLVVDIKKRLGSLSLDVKFEVTNGVFAILGASGCGKSMTLKCISGIEKPDSGYIELDGNVFFDSKKNININPQKRNVGYLFQNYALFPNMNVEENIKTGIRKNKYSKINEESTLLGTIKKFHITGLEKRYPNELSGGEQQRTALGRIFISNPKIIMLDEPLSALDSFMKWSLEQVIIERLNEFNGISLFVSHNRDEVYRICDNIGILENGKLEIIEEKHKLFANPKTYSAALLTGCKNFSKAKKISENEIEATDWNIIINQNKIVPNDIRYIGIRSHFFFDPLYKQTEEEYIYIECKIIKIIEDIFSYIIMLKPINGKYESYVRWDIEKNDIKKYATGKKLKLAAKKNDIMHLI